MAKAKLQRIPVREENQPDKSLVITNDIIAQRAYALYLARGAQDGHDLEDWLQAERELQEAKNPPAKLLSLTNPAARPIA
jgi:Protein of unknown function (DUF2934)